MKKTLAAIYKKVKITDNLYLYKFVDVIENGIYNVEEGNITYYKKGKKTTLYDMEDLEFTISEEKYCFSDYLDIDSLKEMYELDENELKEHFKEDCKSFIRFGIFDDEKEVLKVINCDIENMKNTKQDYRYSDFSVAYETGAVKTVIFNADVIEQTIEALENNKVEDVITSLISVRDAIDLCGEIVENKTEEKEDKEEKVDTNYMEQLDELIGLYKIKKEVLKLSKYLAFVNKTNEILNLRNPNLNLVFFGNPGTGKTTVARAISSMFYSLGYVKKNKFVELTAQEFIAEYVGQTAVKTRELLDKNKGGVIFIDEAYIFCSEGQEYGNEAIVEIMKEMEKKETVFIFAGYKNEMKNFITMNPGLKSRVGTYLDFPDYNLDELYQIFDLKMKKAGFKLDEDIKNKIIKIISSAKTKEHFGNARFIDNLFDKIVMNHASRCHEMENKEDMILITNEDTSLDIEDETKLFEFEKVKTIGF